MQDEKPAIQQEQMMESELRVGMTEGPKRRGFSVGEVVAWVVILAMVGLIVYRVQAGKRGNGGDGVTHNFQIELTARYVVGAKSVLSVAGKAYAGELLKSFEGAVRTPRDELRAAIVAGEFLGVEEAVKRLRAVVEKHEELRLEAGILKEIVEGGALPEGEKGEKLRAAYGWILELAESLKLAASDPKRVAVERAGMRTFAGVLGLVGLGLGGLLIGVVLFVVAIVQIVRGKIRAAFEKGKGNRGVYVEGFALFLVTYVGGSMVMRAAGWDRWALVLLPAGLLAALAWPLVRGQTGTEWRSALGLSWGKGVFWEVLAGVSGYLAGLPIVVGGMLVTLVLMRVTGEETGHPIVQELGGPGWMKAGLFVLAAVWAPISEELLFRGALYASVRQRVGAVFSAVIVAVVFAAIHPQGIAAIPVLASLAIVFALMREWRQSIIAPMVGHAINNGVVVLMTILMIG